MRSSWPTALLDSLAIIGHIHSTIKDYPESKLICFLPWALRKGFSKQNWHAYTRVYLAHFCTGDWFLARAVKRHFLFCEKCNRSHRFHLKPWVGKKEEIGSLTVINHLLWDLSKPFVKLITAVSNKLVHHHLWLLKISSNTWLNTFYISTSAHFEGILLGSSLPKKVVLLVSSSYS